MNFRFTAQQEEFRKEFVSWVEKNLPDNWGQTGLRYYKSQDELKQGYVVLVRDYDDYFLPFNFKNQFFRIYYWQNH